MRALIIMHVESEGPGTLGRFLKDNNVELVYSRMYKGDPLPEDPGQFQAIITMGGPMNVYEGEKYPFLNKESSFLAISIEMGIPMIGICLGAQMIAKAANSPVVRSPKEEIGWGTVQLTEQGANDRLFRGIKTDALDVFQWHGDMFHVPGNGSLLATGRECQNQAFRLKNAYGFQFHVEVNREIIQEWFNDSEKLEQMLHTYDKIEKDYTQRATLIYSNFLDLAAEFK